MKTIEVNITETGRDSFRLTFNGYVRGDSRGFSKEQAIIEARKYHNRKNGDWIDCVEIYICKI